MPFLFNGVPLPLPASSQREIAAAKFRADLINVHATAQILGVDVRTLRRWNNDGVGPTRKSREGKRPILYGRTEVQQFAACLSGKRLVRVQTHAIGHPDADHVQTSSAGHAEAKNQDGKRK
jgi:MerR HTH family regulatory protein